MTIGSVLLATALLLVVGIVVLRPILIPSAPHTVVRSRRQALVDQKEALLAHLRALDFDYETGKIPEAEYQRDRAAYLQEAADLLRRIDQMPVSDPLDAQIEAAIARLRNRPAPVPEPALVTTSRAEAAGYCTQCGSALEATHRFCPSCGHKVA